MKNNLLIKTTLRSLIVLGVFAFFASAFANWSGPTMPMPEGNAYPPVHKGVNIQEKVGPLVVHGFRVLDPDTDPNSMNNTLSIFDGQIQLKGGTPELNKILASTGNTGVATWKTLAELGGGGGGGMVNPMTTLGDMIYGLSGGVPERLPIGSAGKILKIVDGIPSWQSAPPAGSNGWTDDGTVVRLTTATDKVGIGTDIEDVLTQQVNLTGNMKFPATSQFYVNGSGYGVLFKPNPERLNGRFMHKNGGTFIGERSGSVILPLTESRNTGIGFYAIPFGSDGVDNTAFGASTLGHTELESRNTAIGDNSNGPDNFDNTSIGHDSLRYFFENPCCSTLQKDNVALGVRALYYSPDLNSEVTRNYNTAIGYKALDSVSNTSSNTALGYNADVGSGALTNATAIGANAVVNASNTMVFGTSSIVGWGFGAQPGADAIKVGGPGTSGSGARLTQAGAWTDGSDRILKYDIKDTKYGLKDILALRPVDYKLKIDNTNGVGFIAQEVKEVVPELVFGKDGEMTMSYGQMTAVLTKAVQELKEENDMLKEMTAILEAEAEKQGY